MPAIYCWSKWRRRITLCVREVDTVARFGGMSSWSCSATWMPTRQSPLPGAIVAEKIRSSLSEPYVLRLQRGGEKQDIGASLYVEHWRGDFHQSRNQSG